jgi:hypothetical protein
LVKERKGWAGKVLKGRGEGSGERGMAVRGVDGRINEASRALFPTPINESTIQRFNVTAAPALGQRRCE